MAIEGLVLKRRPKASMNVRTPMEERREILVRSLISRSCGRIGAGGGLQDFAKSLAPQQGDGFLDGFLDFGRFDVDRSPGPFAAQV
jgi:hypothetical protein